jgi:hypothetical protein
MDCALDGRRVRRERETPICINVMSRPHHLTTMRFRGLLQRIVSQFTEGHKMHSPPFLREAMRLFFCFERLVDERSSHSVGHP